MNENEHTKHDASIAAFILSLLSLYRIGNKTVNSMLIHERERITSAAHLDANFIEQLNQAPSAASKSAVSKIYKALLKSDATWEELEGRAWDQLELAKNKQIAVLHPLSQAYPKRLLWNESFPTMLYCRGDADILNSDKAVAVIGTRQPTSFGERMGKRFAQILAEDGYVIVSGLAIGCDTLGHEGALEAGGKTVAVLATPIDAPVYPSQNQALAERIVEAGGALVCEYGPGTTLGDRQLVTNLVARDEWQAGLADGVAVIETGAMGGSRHALNHALNTKTPIAAFDYSSCQNFDFFANPRFGGNVEYLKSGSNVTSIYEPETIKAFEHQMELYHKRHTQTHGGSDQEQPSLF